MHESMLATLGLGFVLGLKHATEADHLAAISTIVSDRRSVRQSAGVGLLWGIGHTTALLLAGFIVLFLGLVIPDRVANVLEFAVALMIIFLGMRLLHMHVHSHVHAGRSHIHLHFREEPHDANHDHGLPGWRPLLVGVVHGLAGSAALTLLVLTQVARDGHELLGLVYLVVFGAGSIGGMLLMSVVISLPFAFGLRVFRQTLLPLRLVTGVCSTCFGIVYAWSTAGKLLL